MVKGSVFEHEADNSRIGSKLLQPALGKLAFELIGLHH